MFLNTTVQEGIRIDFIGDSGPFSRTGKSIGYRLMVKDSAYLIDMGGPVFQFLGHDGIRDMKGVFATHSHEDHRRWFTDVCLFMYYVPDIPNRLRLITTEVVHDEWEKNSKAALERSLSADQKRVVEVPYEDFVEKVLYGPRAKYRIVPFRIPFLDEVFIWRVVDSHNQVVSPADAKIVIHPQANRPRLLFKDPEIGEWVEPETFYSLKDQRFYEAEQNVFYDEECGLTARPVKSVAWHGPPTYGIEFTTATERVLFSSDTVYDPELWHKLAHEHHTPRITTTMREFEREHIIIGDINDYIERTWSIERLQEAQECYEGGVVIHDVDYDGSIVHTSYSKLHKAGFKNVFCTHSPDDFVSEMPLARERKTFRILNNRLHEEVEDKLYPYKADLWMKRHSMFFVGFKNPKGKFPLIKSRGRLHIRLPGDPRIDGETLGNYDLYADIDGKYYAPLDDPHNKRYYRRPDGRIDLITYSEKGCHGVALENLRDDLILPLDCEQPKK